MNFIKEHWALVAAAIGAWLSNLQNETLQKIVSLLTIAAITLGLLDWGARKIRGKVRKKNPENTPENTPGGSILEQIEGSQKPFKTVNMLDNPIEPGEKIGNFVDKISTLQGGVKMKKFFKWVWYNKEQLSSILYQALLLALANFMLFTDTFDLVATVYLGAPMPLWIKITAIVVSLGMTALSVRNICVKYGLSSLDTIEQVLTEKAQAAENRLTSEQKKEIKAQLATLQQTLAKTKEALAAHEKELAEVNTLYNADNSLVTNYAARTAELKALIARCTKIVPNIEAKIAQYKAQLSGNTTSDKA